MSEHDATGPEPAPLITAEHLYKTFHGPGSRVVEAVRGVSLQVHAGEVMGLLGPNGAGKTTLLRMLATIIPPTSGTCRAGANIPDKDRPEDVRRQIGFLSGNTKLYGRLTARETLIYFGRLYGMPEGAIRQRAEELIAMLHMEAFEHQRCETLSTGQTQRVSIARVLMHDPPVLILDEPTLGLDIMTSQAILDFILAARAEGRAIIYSTHYMTEAELLCDRVALIHEGRIMATGTQPELFEQSGTANLKDAFLAMVRQAPETAA